ncbi:MAG: endonuclease/exonuclease/phosphatase family protein [Candidatus Kariarchaeaceae archaeon]|jgi:endonuclease/exonuclease/phosphatase family metal-dependent hydrolase
MASFSLVSWNMALGQPSFQAPDWWDVNHNVNQILDEIERYQPDFICLQEMPNEQLPELIMDEYAYAKPAPSHSGFSTVFIHRSTIADCDVKLDSQFTLTSASGALLSLNDEPLIVFSLHLPPYKQNAPLRKEYLIHLMSQLPEAPLVLAGDMNMREEETQGTVDAGLTDAYLHLEPGPEHRFTWDSRINHFYSEVNPFVARFDRILTHQLEPTSFQLMGNDVQTNEHHFLSDHFGIYVEIGWKS